MLLANTKLQTMVFQSTWWVPFNSIPSHPLLTVLFALLRKQRCVFHDYSWPFQRKITFQFSVDIRLPELSNQYFFLFLFATRKLFVCNQDDVVHFRSFNVNCFNESCTRWCTYSAQHRRINKNTDSLVEVSRCNLLPLQRIDWILHSFVCCNLICFIYSIAIQFVVKGWGSFTIDFIP